MAIVDIKVPSPGESISEVRIAQWLVKDGDVVAKDQVIAEIDSDKATLELSAEEEGKIQILAAADATVNVGDVVAKLDTSVKGAAAPKKEAPAPKAEAKAQGRPRNVAAQKAEAGRETSQRQAREGSLGLARRQKCRITAAWRGNIARPSAPKAG